MVTRQEIPSKKERVQATCFECAGDQDDRPMIIYDSDRAGPPMSGTSLERAEWWAAFHNRIFPEHLVILLIYLIQKE